MTNRFLNALAGLVLEPATPETVVLAHDIVRGMLVKLYDEGGYVCRRMQRAHLQNRRH